MKILLSLTLLLISANAFAGGAVVAGGKTNAAILVYENELSWEYRKLIYAEIDQQFAEGVLAKYESVTDPNGKPAMCAHFKLLRTYQTALATLTNIASQAGTPKAVESVGSCVFFDVVY